MYPTNNTKVEIKNNNVIRFFDVGPKKFLSSRKLLLILTERRLKFKKKYVAKRQKRYVKKIVLDNCQFTSFIDHNSVKKSTLKLPREKIKIAIDNNARIALCSVIKKSFSSKS